MPRCWLIVQTRQLQQKVEDFLPRVENQRHQPRILPLAKFVPQKPENSSLLFDVPLARFLCRKGGHLGLSSPGVSVASPNPPHDFLPNLLWPSLCERESKVVCRALDAWAAGVWARLSLVFICSQGGYGCSQIPAGHINGVVQSIWNWFEYSVQISAAELMYEK